MRVIDAPTAYDLNLGRVLEAGFPEPVQRKILAENFEALLGRRLP